jgi:hypothetical protein
MQHGKGSLTGAPHSNPGQALPADPPLLEPGNLAISQRPACHQEVASSPNIPGTILSKNQNHENGAKQVVTGERNGCLSTSEASGGDPRQEP